MDSTTLLGIRIDAVTRKEAKDKVLEFFLQKKIHTIFTPNPEMLVEAVYDPYFQKVLNSASLNLCDGRGIELFSPKKIERIPGVNFVFDICALAEQAGESVYLLGSAESGILERARAKLLLKFPLLNINGVHPGVAIQRGERGSIHYDQLENTRLVQDIIDKKSTILLVAFGHGKQEKWIYENAPKLPSVKIAMGVGGSLDFISGHKKRAPQWLQKIGLEWLFRLLQEPSRFWRIVRATIIFPYLVWRSR